VTVAQFPNKELIAALTAAVIGHFTYGAAHSLSSSLFYVFLIIWAYREIAEGANWLRRGLGLVVMAYILVSLTHRL
jgi:hypothetical protein